MKTMQTTQTINLTTDQIEHLWLLLAHEVRELQDTKVTDENSVGMENSFKLNSGITKELRKAWYKI